MTWPNDADGDVFRRMEESRFDFSKPHLIDFNVDFRSWPPPKEAVRLMSQTYPSTKVHNSKNDDGQGYIQFQVYDKVTYELVTRVQAYVSELMAPFNGECSSWGVLQEPVPVSAPESGPRKGLK